MQQGLLCAADVVLAQLQQRKRQIVLIVVRIAADSIAVNLFSVRRIIGTGNLWVTEFILTYDGRPSYTVSIMEFQDGKVAHETQYFGDPFEPGPSRAHLVERMR